MWQWRSPLLQYSHMNTRAEPTPKRPVLYCRISKDAEEKGLGVARQELETREHLARLGWPDPDVIVDNDLSASTFAIKARPGYQRLIRGLADGTWDGVGSWDSDRLIRQMDELQALIRIIGEHEIRIPVETRTSGTYDLTTIDGRMVARIKVSVSQAEAERISQRTKSEKLQAAAAGRFSGGRRPFGFEPDGVTHNAEEAALIRRAAVEIIEGRALNEIAREAGVDRTVLRRSMLSARVRGVRTHQGAEFGKAAWKRILDSETQREVAAVLSDPKRRRGPRPRSYLLAGIIETPDGHKLRSRPDHRPGGVVLRRYRTMEGAGVSASADPLEAFVVEALLRRMDEQVLPVIENVDAEAAAKEVAACQAELVKLRELRRADALDLDDYVFEKGLVEARLRGAEARIPEPVDEVDESVAELSAGELRRRWNLPAPEGLTFEQKRSVVLRHVRRVRVAPSAKRGRGFDTSRVEIDWAP